ncbi:MAG: DegT/DnrJ/EryC1/StrS family aminotransferase [Candidatus Omnitrophota bacterium]
MRFRIRHSKPTISAAELKAVSKVLKSSYVASGKVTENFQKTFKKIIKVNFALATNSGTSALHLALLALKIKRGDEVVIPSYVCSAVLNAVLYTGAKPKIADINLFDFNLSLKDTKRLISRKTKAIILSHMFGKPADIRSLLKLGVPIIENCAQSLGALYKGRPTGSFGDVSVFSFYATKLITTGYGGMICSKNNNLVKIAEDLINFDERKDYKIRYNYKMSDVAACLGISQLKQLKSFISKRREIASYYNKGLKSNKVLLPEDKEKNHIYFRYVVRVEKGIDRVIGVLNNKGIEAKKPVFKPLHHYLKLDRKKFPNTEAVFNSAISLPIYPGLRMAEAKYIVQALNR